MAIVITVFLFCLSHQELKDGKNGNAGDFSMHYEDVVPLPGLLGQSKTGTEPSGAVAVNSVFPQPL